MKILSFSLIVACFATPAFAKTIACETAYQSAFQSPAAGAVYEAAVACSQATQEVCSHPIEGKYTEASCNLKAALGANSAANNGDPAPECSDAYTAAQDPASKADFAEVTTACWNSTKNLCEKAVENGSSGGETGDGTYLLATCQLRAEHGSFQEVLKLK